MTPKKEKFCREYIIDLNATQAAIRAGYSKKTASSQGERLLRNVEISKRIEELKTEQQDRLQVKADDVIKEMARIALLDVADVIDDDGCLMSIKDIPIDSRKAIASIEVTEEYEGTGKNRKLNGYINKVRFWDKNKALDNLGKHFGIYEVHEKQKAQGLAELLKELSPSKGKLPSDDERT